MSEFLVDDIILGNDSNMIPLALQCIVDKFKKCKKFITEDCKININRGNQSPFVYASDSHINVSQQYVYSRSLLLLAATTTVANLV
jgi:hypothetical protein